MHTFKTVKVKLKQFKKKTFSLYLQVLKCKRALYFPCFLAENREDFYFQAPTRIIAEEREGVH